MVPLKNSLIVNVDRTHSLVCYTAKVFFCSLLQINDSSFKPLSQNQYLKIQLSNSHAIC